MHLYYKQVTLREVYRQWKERKKHAWWNLFKLRVYGMRGKLKQIYIPHTCTQYRSLTPYVTKYDATQEYPLGLYGYFQKYISCGCIIQCDISVYRHSYSKMAKIAKQQYLVSMMQHAWNSWKFRVYQHRPGVLGLRT